jgi:hypothetical protein
MLSQFEPWKCESIYSSRVAGGEEGGVEGEDVHLEDVAGVAADQHESGIQTSQRSHRARKLFALHLFSI